MFQPRIRSVLDRPSQALSKNTYFGMETRLELLRSTMMDQQACYLASFRENIPGTDRYPIPRTLHVGAASHVKRVAGRKQELSRMIHSWMNCRLGGVSQIDEPHHNYISPFIHHSIHYE